MVFIPVPEAAVSGRLCPQASCCNEAIPTPFLVMFTGIVDLVIYLCTRPQGSLVPCARCANKRLPVSAICPHCGNA